MSDLDQLWEFLEHQPVLAGVIAQWRDWLGPAFDVTKNFFLRRTGDISNTYPCPAPRAEGCPRRVVIHADNDIVAVCGNWPPECEKIQLSRDDLAIYELRLDSIARHVARACGFDGPSGEVVDGLDGVRSIGTFTPSTGARAPAYLVIPDLEQGYGIATRHLVAIHRNDKPLLVVPTGERLKPADRRLIDSRVVGTVACRDFLAWDGARQLVATTSVERMLAGSAATTEPLMDDSPPKAVCFTHHSTDFVPLKTEEEIKTSRTLKRKVDHFVDATAPSRPSEKRTGKRRKKGSLRPGEVLMLVAYLLRYKRGEEPIRPENLPLDNPGKGGRYQAFKILRSTIDTDGVEKKQKRLFKSHPSTEGRAYRYNFNPDPGTSYCFIFPVETLQTVRQQLKK